MHSSIQRFLVRILLAGVTDYCNSFVARCFVVWYDTMFCRSSGDGRVGVLGKHSQRHGGLHATLRGLSKDPPPPPSQEREAGGTPVQEVGGGCAGFPLRCGGGGLHGEQFLSAVDPNERRTLILLG